MSQLWYLWTDHSDSWEYIFFIPAHWLVKMKISSCFGPISGLVRSTPLKEILMKFYGELFSVLSALSYTELTFYELKGYQPHTHTFKRSIWSHNINKEQYMNCVFPWMEIVLQESVWIKIYENGHILSLPADIIVAYFTLFNVWWTMTWIIKKGNFLSFAWI